MPVGPSLLLVLAALAPPGLDFELYRERVEPIFVDKRPGHARCYTCHSRRTRFRLQKLPKERTTWTEEESRRNFASVLRVVVPGKPLQSRLLTMPLAEKAGGRPFHPGGKFWESRDDPEWRMLAGWVARGAREAATPALDFETYRSRVEPIFLEKREGHARCYVCHRRRTRFRLEKLAPGQAQWTEAQSRKNFERVRRLVVPGKPLESRLLTMALAEAAGGKPFHPGGKFWSSKEDPEWKVLADWVEKSR